MLTTARLQAIKADIATDAASVTWQGAAAAVKDLPDAATGPRGVVYLVSGYMRSGTSMMMACLEAGGMGVARSPCRDALNDAHGDSRYRPNPEGLYEPDPRRLREPAWWRAQAGRAVKCVAPWLRWLPAHRYRVVFMRRDPEEIRQSFEGAFGGRLSRAEVEEAVAETLLTLRNRRDVADVAEVDYRGGALADPLGTFSRLASSGWPVGPAGAAAVVDPSLCRFRRERLTEGL